MRPFSTQLAARNLQFCLLIIATMAGIFARSTLSPLQETMRIVLTLSDNRMALLQGPALALPMLVVAVPLGLAIDRYSRVRLLLLFAVLDVVGSILTATASGFLALLLARCLVGMTATAISTTAYSLLADLYAPAARGRASMLLAVGQFAGVAAAFALGGELIAQAPLNPSGWRWAMLWLTAPLLPVVLLMLAMREPPRTGTTLQNPSARETIVELWRYRAVAAPLLISIVMIESVLVSVLVWAAPTLSRSFALAPNRIGAIMATGLMLSGLMGPIAGGLLADVCQRSGGPRRTIQILSGVAWLSAPLCLFALSPSVVAASGVLVALMTVESAILVMGTTLFTIVVPNELRGLCMALLAGSSALFGALAPLLVSQLSGVLGGPAMLGKALTLICLTAMLMGAGMFTFGIQSFPRTAAH